MSFIFPFLSDSIFTFGGETAAEATECRSIKWSKDEVSIL